MPAQANLAVTVHEAATMFRQSITSIIISSAIMLSASGAHAFIGTPPQSWENLSVAGEKALDKEQYKEAEAALKAARQATAGNTNKELMTLDTLAELYDEQENYPAEEQALLSSLSLMQSLRDYPVSVIGATHLKLAIANVFMGRLEPAEKYAQTALLMLKDSLGPVAPDVAVALNNLGWIEYELDKLGPSETHLRKSLYIARQTFGEKTVLYGMTASNLAGLYVKKGNRASAAFWYKRSDLAFNAALGAKDELTRETARLWHALQQTPDPGTKRPPGRP